METKDLYKVLELSKEALAGGDVEEIKNKQEALVTASHKLSEALYSQVQDQQQQSAASESADADDLVEDAEVVEDEDQQDGERR